MAEIDSTKLNGLEIRNFEDLQQGYKLANDFVQKKYLRELSLENVVSIPKHIQDFTVRNNIRLYKVTKLVYDKNENHLDKFGSVYQALHNVRGSLILIIDSDGNEISLFLGVRSKDSSSSVQSAKEVLEKSFIGNFSGSEVQNLRNTQIEELIEEITNNKNKVISAVSGVPSLKNDDFESYVQGLEKFIDAMQGEKFSSIFISDPLSDMQLEEIKNGYENLYSRLAPFAKSELSFQANESLAVTEGISTGFSESINESFTKTTSYTKGSSDTEGSSETKGSSRSLGGGLGAVGAGAGFLIGGPAGSIVLGSIAGGVGALIGSTNKSEQINKSSTTNVSDTSGQSDTHGKSKTNSTQENKSDTLTTGSSKQLQISFENKSVQNMLVLIDKQIERIEKSSDYGMWNTSCYFLGPNYQTTQVAASTFQAMMRGENSSIEQSQINTWDDQNSNFKKVSQYLAKLNHPLIELKVENGLDLPYVTPSSLLSGQELVIPFSLPKKSVSGLPVIESVEFGRNVISYTIPKSENHLNLGRIFHMGKIENTLVNLDIQSLSMHTFITGSTGSGKSNTIYHILQELLKKDVNFLVVEPAKGEYKEVFGGRGDVNVFGTNPRFAPLLKLNPFRFPNDVHVLEHIDRLIEIFNACWPMYAAMPAVLKDAVEQTYEKVGWNLEFSISYDEIPTYPTFYDLLEILPEVINQSGYSEELKANYNGALVTRVRTLTTGLVGRIFTDDEVDNELLFDKNCIVDISRIGSSETKSLIMGILFMRLQEHRQSYTKGMNNKLKHVTVLEEAHHLLRRTSSEQSQEGANLQGKSVEMISAAIAEMRTYGEGFIIADQSPNLLDASVIRNTNTKIILRLPDGSDRYEVGKSASLTEDQINEIPKLKTGVAVVYQNDWLQPILCSVEYYDNSYPYSYKLKDNYFKYEQKNRIDIVKLLLIPRVSEKSKVEQLPKDIEGLERWLKGASFNKTEKDKLLYYLGQYKKYNKMDIWNQDKFDELASIITKILKGDEIIKYAKATKDLNEWNQRVKSGLEKYIGIDNMVHYENAIIQCFLKHKTLEDESFKKLYFKWREEIDNRVLG